MVLTPRDYVMAFCNPNTPFGKYNDSDDYRPNKETEVKIDIEIDNSQKTKIVISLN